MASILAIVSKALFEKMVPKDVKPGTVVDTDRYLSNNKTFDRLKEGGAVFMVTVRPPDEKLWLVAVLENPKKKGDAWIASANTTPIADVTSAIKKLRFESDTGITAKKGALGMSLQTPRVLTEKDVALLRGLVPKEKAAKKVGASAAYKEAVEDAVAGKGKKKKGAAAKNGGGGLRLERYRKPFTESLDDLEPHERKQLELLTGEKGKKFEGMFGADPEEIEEWSEAGILDVVDASTDETKYELHLCGYGDGAMFAAGTTKVVANLCQHGFDPVEKLGKAFMQDLAKAWSEGAKRLKYWEGHIDFKEEDFDEAEEE
jgi:hypothetical protein